MTMRDPIFLTLEEVKSLHSESLARYGGLEGVRDLSLLESALGQPKSTFCGENLHLSLFEMAAAYLFSITKNHPFLDGNKRTGFGCAVVFLRINGIDLRAAEDEAYQLVIDTAAGVCSKEQIAEFLRLRSLPNAQ